MSEIVSRNLELIDILSNLANEIYQYSYNTSTLCERSNHCLDYERF